MTVPKFLTQIGTERQLNVKTAIKKCQENFINCVIDFETTSNEYFSSELEFDNDLRDAVRQKIAAHRNAIQTV